jgi:Flp pilus assembly protein TadG
VAAQVDTQERVLGFDCSGEAKPSRVRSDEPASGINPMAFVAAFIRDFGVHWNRQAGKFVMRVNRSWNRRTNAAHPAEQRRGAAMVEMALVLPVFVALMLGVIEFGRAIMVGQLVTNAAREGCRQAILDGSTNTAVSDFVKQFLADTANVAKGDVAVTVAVGNPAAGGQLVNAQSRDLVTISVSLPFSKVSFLPPTFLKTTNLSAQSAMRHE